MTVLTEYQRLEATGLWRETEDSQRREVLVSLGDATLMISTLSETALSHWSLPAIERLNPGKTPALYAPDTQADEILELSEPEMIAAIEKVRGVIERSRPHPGRLRLVLGALISFVIVMAVIFWLPGALLRQTAAVLPDAKRAELGRQILAEMATLAGRPCGDTAGVRALAGLARETLGPDAPRLVVLPSSVPGSAHLPGDIIVLNRSLVEDYETPEVLAGYLLAEDERRAMQDPAVRLLEEAGLVATFRMLTTGEIDPRHLHAHAATLLTRTPQPVTDDALLARFAAAELSSEPYAFALDLSGETTLPLIEGDPMRARLRAPLLPDESWVALQQICGG
ncbi:hypothetical protein [Rhodophyticola porphyridii]|uniref:Uncharacterized protein n=1 Tax=Rhodophyticola porphyridii TaxID=1852017 RepID=A0A3L9Y5Z5_9RHOB|nr:hypothetical protein [Rhodophyticola porphyridii]RMA41763.1 hypothetical protein D9R08_12945 [Rhodophyticola porphyridii]